jgi:guanylate kinase
MPPSMAELERRLRGRNTETDEQLEVRLRQAEKEMTAVQGRVWPGRRQFDYVIVNDTVERASDQLATAIQEIRGKNHE